MPRHIRILNRDMYYPGHLLMRQGDPGGSAFFIESGKLEVYLEDEHGHHVTIAELGPNSIVGEMALISKGNRSASVKVIEDAVLIQITAHDFHDKLEQTDRVFRTIMRVLVERLSHTNQFLLDTEANLEDLENHLGLTIDKMSNNINPDKQEEFITEVTPLLQQIQDTIKKYK